jgi:hypothetical protein
MSDVSGEELIGPADLREFWEAVTGFPVDEPPMAVSPEAENRLRACLAAGGPVLLGEKHGAAENPLQVFALMRRFDLRVLALEWDADLTPALDAYLATGDLDGWPPQLAWSSDGRITAGHLAVLRALRGGGHLDRVVLFDGYWAGDWNERDRMMAERLLAGIAGAPPALVVAGNLHTRLQPHEHGVPMGHHVALAMSGTTEIRMEYLGGEIFNLRRRPAAGLARRPRLRPAPVPSLWVDRGGLVLTLPRVHAAVVPNPRDLPPAAGPRGAGD